MSLVTLAWVFGSAWAAATDGAALTRFAQGLGATQFQFGLLDALLSVPAGLWPGHTGRRKGRSMSPVRLGGIAFAIDASARKCAPQPPGTVAERSKLPQPGAVVCSISAIRAFKNAAHP
jgi:hypothetical protein